MLRSPRTGGRALLAAVLLAGCASLPPEKPLSSINEIVGTWRGLVRFGLGPYQFLYVTFNPDSTMVAQWGVNTKWGRVSLLDGRGHFELYIWSGTLYYYEGPEDRVIIMQAVFAEFDAQVRPLN
jgi:hypothetical protein